MMALLVSLLGSGVAAAQSAVSEIGEPLEGELVLPDGELIMVPTGPRSGYPSRELSVLEARARRQGWSRSLRIRAAQLLVQRARRRLSASARLEYVRRNEGLAPNARIALLRQLSERDGADALEMLRVALLDAPRPYTREVAQATLLSMVMRDGLGERAAAADVAERLADACPTCPAAASAHVYLADRAFEDGDLSRASRHYAAAVVGARAPREVVAYAHYRLGWLLYNLGSFEMGFVAFESARTLTASDVMRRWCARYSLRVLAYVAPSPVERAAIIARLGGDRRHADALARRFETALRDGGLDEDADEFRRVWATRRRRF